MTVILIAIVFVAFVASPALVALWPRRVEVDEASTRTAGRALSSFSAPTPANRG